MDPIEIIDIMLKHKSQLTSSEYEWVHAIDMTVSEFDGLTQLTVRQQEVIEDIFAKYSRRGGPINL